MKQEIKERIERIQKGEVPEGYKETKIGILPEDWELEPLGNLFNFKNGVNAEAEKYGKGIKFINIMEIINNNALSSKLIPGEVELSKKAIKENLVIKGDVLFNRTSETAEDIGLTSVYLDNAEVVFGGFVIRGREKKKVLHYEYKKYCFRFSYLRNQMRVRGQGVVRSNIGQKDLEKVMLPIPSTNEQQKIAEILSTWDKAIELKEKLIEEKKEFKRGLMQKLLFKRVANNISWNETQLRKCLIPTSYPINKPSESYYALGIRSHCKGTLVRHIEDPKKVAMDTLYEVKENELIANITFAWEGAITILSKKDEGKIVSHRFPTYKFNKEYAIPDYFKHLIKTKWFVFQLGLLSPGGAGRNRVLNKTDFLKLKVILPSVEEQRKISNFLNSIDNEVDLLNKELNQLKEQKRGLMQLLLTGIVRVEVD